MTQSQSFKRECTWRGSFRYETQNDGHQWKFTNRQKWSSFDENGKISKFSKTANLVYSKKTEIEKSLKIKNIDWTFVDWLANKSSPKKNAVGTGLSIVLNTIVRNATFKPFQILSSFVDEHVTVEINELGEGVPCWFYLRYGGSAALPEYLLGMPELFFSPNNNLKALNNIQQTFSKLKCIRALHKYSIERFVRNDDYIEITLNDNLSLHEYVKGRVCGCIPIPGKPKRERKQCNEPAEINTPEVVVESPVVASALEELSMIWRDPFAKSVLISAPPGSGKEVMAKSIPYGNGRPTKNMQALAMTDPDQKALLRQLYGYVRADGSIEPGLISQAAKSAIFLDEIHQPDKKSPARVSLLRPLESDEFYPTDSGRPQKVDNVLFVMATSRTLDELKDYEPPDFWTRMTHAIQVRHPLDIRARNWGEKVIPVLSKFFCFFWWERVEIYYQLSPTCPLPKKDDGALIRFWQMKAMMEVIEDNKTRKFSAPSVFATVFIDLLLEEQKLPSNFSIRGIRSIVTRLFSMAAAEVSQGKSPWSDETKGEDAFAADICRIFREISKVAQLAP